MKRKLTLRMIAMMMAVVMVAGSLSGCKGSTTNPQGQTQPNQSENESETGEPEQETETEEELPDGYVRVKFALPEDATESEQKYTTLPETLVVPEGTELSKIPEAKRMSSMFMGWSDDPSCTRTMDSTAKIDKSVTLYPSFALKDGMQDGGALSYVAKKDVATDFAFEVISYGLTEEEVARLLRLDNASLGVEGLEMKLESLRKKEEVDKIKEIVEDEEVASQVYDLIRKEEQGKDEFDLQNALMELKKDGEKEAALTIEQIQKIRDLYPNLENNNDTQHVRTDADGNEFPGTGEDLGKTQPEGVEDPELAAILSALSVDLETATEKEIKACFGLAEDDSLERYFREDLELTVEQVQTLADLLIHRTLKGEHYLVTLKDGELEGGYLYSLAILNTEKLRFVFDGEVTDAVVEEYNVTVHADEVKNISVDPKVVYLDAAKVQGVDFVSILDLEMDSEGNLIPKENTGKGVMTYSGDEALKSGSVLAISKGKVADNGFTSDDVTYIKIKNYLGDDKYEYENAAVADVIFLPDLIPVKDDGSLSDGVITVPESELNFQEKVFSRYGLSDQSTIDAGDYLTFYTGTLNSDSYSETGYGEITEVKNENGKYTLKYKTITKEKVYDSEDLLYMELPEVELTLTPTESKQLEEDMKKKIMDSGMVEETSEFLTSLVLDEDLDMDSFEHADELLGMMILGEDGEELSLDGLRLLADGAEKVEVSDVEVSFIGGLELQHFEGKKGIRAEFSVSFTISIKIGDSGKLEIQPMLVLEQEFLLTPTIKVHRNKNKLGLTSSLDITATLEAGTYTGFGVCVTAQTKEEDNEHKDDDWESVVGSFAADNGFANDDPGKQKTKTDIAKGLIGAGNILIDKATFDEASGQGFGASREGDENKTGAESRKDFSSPGFGGDLPTKYSGMLGNDSEYIPLVEVDLASADFPVDPLNIVHCGIKITFHVDLKINAMIGAGICYENAKEYSYSTRCKIWGGGDEYTTKNISDKKGSSVKDVATPNFRADFYAFGMVGVRAGLSIEVRVGLFSTELDSVGIEASAGIYAELYGFLYCWYEWTSGKGSTSGAMGSLLFEIGIYTDIDVKVQVGMGKASKSWSLYSKKTPLVQLGCTDFPLDFTIEEDSEDLSVNIPDGENTVKISDEIFKMNLMSLSSGEVSEQNMDSKHVCDKDTKKYNVTIDTNGKVKDDVFTLSTERSWIQYNEDHFLVECFDLTKKDGERKTGASSFQYLPETNEIYICPLDLNTDEVWGEVEFTYKNNCFGFSTQKLQRTVKVHWKGTRQTAKVEFFIQERPDHSGYHGQWKQAGSGSVSGYDGIRCYVTVDEKLTGRYPGYNLLHLGYPDETELNDKMNILEPEMERAHKAYQSRSAEQNVNSDPSKAEELDKKTKEAFQKWATMRALHSLYYNLLNDYKKTNEEAIAAGKGTTYFTMRGSTTVIRIYYQLEEYPTSFDIFGEELPERGFAFPDAPKASSEWTADETIAWYGRSFHVAEQWVQPDHNAMDYIPEELRTFENDAYDTEWYMYEYKGEWNPYKNMGCYSINTMMTFARNDAVEKLRTGDMTGLTKVTASTKVPHSTVVFIGVQKPKEFTVTWKDDEGGNVLATTKVAYGHEIIPPEGLNPEKDEYELSHWITMYGEEIDKMPAKNIDVFPAYIEKMNCKAGKHRFAETVVKEPTCTEEGDLLLECIGCHLQKHETIPVDPEAHKAAEKRANVKEETCVADGYEGDIVCEYCGKILEEGKVIPATGKHVDNGIYIIEKEATCKEYGAMVSHCRVCGIETDRVRLTPIALNHVWGPTEIVKKPTCVYGLSRETCQICGETREDLISATDSHNFVLKEETGGNCVTKSTLHYVCSVCGETMDEEGKIDPDQHEHLSEKRTTKEATCFEAGTIEWTCKDCGKKFTERIEPTGCDYEFKYEWSADLSKVTATRICKNDSDHNITETVYTDRMVTKKATCTEEGTVVITTRKFAHPDIFKAQTKTLTEKAIGHDWGDPTYTWNDSNTQVTAKRICKNDASHVEQEVATVTSKVTKNPTDTEKGETTYTATFTNSAFKTQTKVLKDIPALKVNWSEVTITWAYDYSWAEASRTNTVNGEVDKERTTNISVSEVKAGCTTDGSRTYTATFQNKDFGTKSTSVTIPKTGHDWAVDTSKSYGPKQQFETYDWGKECTGWIPGCTEEYCKNKCGIENRKTAILVPLAISAEGYYITITGENQIRVDLGEWCEGDTLENVFGDTTLKELLTERTGFWGVAHHSSIDAAHPGWYYEDESEFFGENRYMVLGRVDVVSLKDSSGAVSPTAKVTSRTSGSVVATLRLTPDDVGTYETTDFTVTVVWK